MMDGIKKVLFWLKRRTLLMYFIQSALTVAVCLVAANFLEKLELFSFGYIIFAESGICFLVMYLTKEKTMLESYDLVKKLDKKYEEPLYDHLQSSNYEFLGLSGFVLMLIGYVSMYLS